jgi:hypothetical protein
VKTWYNIIVVTNFGVDLYMMLIIEMEQLESVVIYQCNLLIKKWIIEKQEGLPWLIAWIQDSDFGQDLF